MNNCCIKCIIYNSTVKKDYAVYCKNPSCECHKNNCELCQFEPENGHALNCIRHPDFSKQEKPEWEVKLRGLLNLRHHEAYMRNGDDCYCTHHPDDNAHGEDCYIDPLEEEIVKLLLSEKKRWVEGQKAELGRHNARILNEFQKQGTGDMPSIAYDERVCLIPAITIATKETLDILSQEIEGMK